MRRLFLAAALAAIMSSPAVAAQGASISLDQPAPTFGDAVTFTWDSPQAQSIQLHCYQPAGRLVFADARMLYEGGWGYGVPFVLGPSASWTGGDADCTAMLGYRAKSGHYRILASTSFHVGA